MEEAKSNHKIGMRNLNIRKQFLNIDQRDKNKDNETLVSEIETLKMRRNSDIDEIKFLKIELVKLMKLFKKYQDITK